MCSSDLVHVDPVTGRILPRPAPGAARLQLSPQERNALSTSHQELVETPHPDPRGGFILNLQGRFRHTLIATTNESGKVVVQHVYENQLHKPE